MKFRVYEHDDGFFAIDIPDLELAWNYLDAGYDLSYSPGGYGDLW